MSEMKRRLVDRVVETDYAGDLGKKTIEELRAMRDECRDGENELSFERRLCQARVDILTAEMERRTGDGDKSSDILDKLPQILATDAVESRGESSHIPERAPDFSVPRNVDVPRRRVEEIAGEQTLARLSSMSTEEIRGLIASLGEHESEVSARRREVQAVVDAIQAEIVRRYVSGEADPSAALG
jgi:hypothetical protein